MVRYIIPTFLLVLTVTACTYSQVDEPIRQDLASSGIVFTTSMHSLIPRSLSTQAVDYFDPKYAQNKRTADTFFTKEENWADIDETASYFLDIYPNAYHKIDKETLSLAIAALLYDELFRRDFADDAEEEALRKGITDENFYWNTLGIAQISPAIHKDTIATALEQELSLEEAATALLSSHKSIRVIPFILYDNHKTDLNLALTRYHSGSVGSPDPRGNYLLSEELRTHLSSLQRQ